MFHMDGLQMALSYTLGLHWCSWPSCWQQPHLKGNMDLRASSLAQAASSSGASAGDIFTPASRSTARDTVADLLRGVRVIGAREFERILPLGTPLTAIGQLACQVDGATAPRAAVRTGTNSILVLQASPMSPPALTPTQQIGKLSICPASRAWW